jgi:hypothetical protein
MRTFFGAGTEVALVLACAAGIIACDGSTRNGLRDASPGTIGTNPGPDASDAGPGTIGTNPGPDASDPYLPATTLSVEPSHQTTANDGAKVLVAGYSMFGTGDTSWLDAGVTLTGGAAHESVPFTGALQVTDNGFAYTLTPTSPLSAGWYSVLMAPPSGAFYFNGTSDEHPESATRRPDGTLESRFRVGSSPLLLAVAACASSVLSSLPKLILTFSEAVDIAATPPIGVTVDGNKVSFGAPDRGDKTMVEFICSPAMPAAAAITVSLTEGIVAVGGGGPLHDATGATTMSLELPPAESNAPCRTWREMRASDL